MNPRALLLAAFLGLAISSIAHGQSALLEAQFVDNMAARNNRCLPDPPVAEPQRFLILSFKIKGQATEDQIGALSAYLTRSESYSFVSDWPGADNLLDISSDNPAFVLDRVTRVKKEVPDLASSEYLVCLRGFLPPRARGEIRIKQPPEDVGWKLSVDLSAVKAPTPTGEDEVALRYTTGNDWPLPRFRAKVQVGTGTGGPSLEASGSGLLSDPKGDVRKTHWNLSAAAKVPLRTPTDVKDTPGAEKDASAKSPDMLSLDLNGIGYSEKGGLTRFGARLRATGSGDGLEATGYYAPFTFWFNDSRGFLGAEAEAGYRKGDAEFKTLTTRAPDRGNLVARVGGVAEWAPALGGVNRNLSTGLRFFVRARGWFDTYDNDSGQRSVRFARFLDSELFYNFDKESRVFLRLENGELPPDLTRRISRVFVGVGQAF